MPTSRLPVKPLTEHQKTSCNTTRRPSQDSGFFNVPTPPESFSEPSSSPADTPMMIDFNTLAPQEDLELDKIVDDVDDMFRYFNLSTYFFRFSLSMVLWFKTILFDFGVLWHFVEGWVVI